MRKRVDPSIQAMMKNCVASNQRGVFVIIGDRGRDQVVNIHYLMSKLTLKAKPKVLWCYKKDLGFTTNQAKREKQLKKKQQSTTLNEDELNDPFTLFLSSQQIRYCYYADTHRILGNTYNLLVLQDFEALTPNTLCRTIETIEGGGIVIFLMKTMSSLKQLYTITMDVHSRFRTHQFQDVQPRFNERFILSLSTLQYCLFMDDELNLLPVSSHAANIKDVEIDEKKESDVQALYKSLKGGHEIVYNLVGLCKTVDQAKIVMGLIDALQEKIFRFTVNINAARGRGKSAAIGMSTAAAVAMGLSNIFVTAPSPENLPTFFEFLVKGLDALGFKENQHFDIIQSTNPEFNKAVVRINIHKTHRQFVQYVLPVDAEKVTGQADLMLVDEAAAIPIPYVKKMFGPYTLVMSSTVNGYEGTGRSLSLKLVQQLREQNVSKQQTSAAANISNGSARMFKEFIMSDPIRYALNDPIERWLYDLLLLDATEASKLTRGVPHPNECELYLVNRDTLFSFQKGSEKFLRSLMSLFIASHYKNTPNDLQLLSDAPAHAIFVLLGPLNQASKGELSLPDILCVLQVCLEGQIPKNIVDQNADKQMKPSGDLIPWTLSKYFLDDHFPSLSGARVVRIATHPSAMNMGYGSKAMELLCRFFEGQLISGEPQKMVSFEMKELFQGGENKSKLPPLLKKLSEVIPPQLNYIGVSFGLTKQVYKFWNKNKFEPAYLSLKKNDVTGEYSCIVVRALSQENDQEESTKLVQAFAADFRSRFVNLLSYDFRDVDQFLCLELLQPNLSTQQDDKLDLQVGEDPNLISKDELQLNFSLSDLQRLDQYCRNMADFYLILDLLPYLCKLFFLHKTGKAVRMSKSQAAILIAMGLQRHSVEDSSKQLSIEVSNILPLFNKSMRKMKAFISSIYELNAQQSLKQKKIKKMDKRQNTVQ